MQFVYLDFDLKVVHDGIDRIFVNDLERNKDYIFLKRKERRPDTHKFKYFKSLSDLQKKLKELPIDHGKVDEIVKSL